MKTWLWEIKDEYIKYGDFHVHTIHTDGKNTILEICQKARQNNLKLIAFTEHIRKKVTYNYNNFLLDVFKARSEFDDIQLLSGCEAKVLNVYGELDIPKEILGKCDLVTGVFHSFKYGDKKNYLKALKAMLRNPAVNIWGHPTLFAKKNNIKLEEYELKEILDICKENGVLIERNIKYNLPEANLIKLAVKRGAKLVIGSDAHSINELLTMQKLKEEWNWINKVY